MICAICNHDHTGPCKECHCAKAVPAHPHKKPYEERHSTEKEAVDQLSFVGNKPPDKAQVGPGPIPFPEKAPIVNPHDKRNQEL